MYPCLSVHSLYQRGPWPFEGLGGYSKSTYISAMPPFNLTCMFTLLKLLFLAHAWLNQATNFNFSKVKKKNHPKHSATGNLRKSFLDDLLTKMPLYATMLLCTSIEQGLLEKWTELSKFHRIWSGDHTNQSRVICPLLETSLDKGNERTST